MVDDDAGVRVLYIARGVGNHERVDNAWVRAKYGIDARAVRRLRDAARRRLGRTAGRGRDRREDRRHPALPVRRHGRDHRGGRRPRLRPRSGAARQDQGRRATTWRWRRRSSPWRATSTWTGRAWTARSRPAIPTRVTALARALQPREPGGAARGGPDPVSADAGLTGPLVRWVHVSHRRRRGPRPGGPSSPRRAAPLGARPGRAGAPRGVPRRARVARRRGAAARHRAGRRRRVRRGLRGLRRGRLRRRRRPGRQHGAQADRRPRGFAEVRSRARGTPGSTGSCRSRRSTSTRRCRRAPTTVWRAYVEAKRDADAALRASDLDWTIIRPGRLTDDPATGLVALGPDVARGDVTRADVAAVLAAVLDEPGTVGRQWNLVNGEVPIAEAVRQG